MGRSILFVLTTVYSVQNFEGILTTHDKEVVLTTLETQVLLLRPILY